MKKENFFGIIAIFSLILVLVTPVISSEQLKIINEKEYRTNLWKETITLEKPYPPEWKDMTAKEIAIYVENLLEENPWNKINESENPPIQEPITAGESPAIYEPPWSYYEDDFETAGGGIGFAWAESGADENKGYAHTITESGPGIGGHSALAWCAHGFWFTSPIQGTYTFEFKYKIKGWAVGFSVDNIIPPGSGFSGGQMYLIFQVKGSEKTEIIVNQQTVPFVHTTYDERPDKTVTCTLQTSFLELETARVSVIAVAKATSSGVAAAGAGAEVYIDDLSNPGAGGILKKVTVSWDYDTNPPETTITGGPSGTIDYNDVKFTWAGNDDKTSVGNLVYSNKLEGYDSSWSSWTSSKSKSYDNLPDKSYNFKVKAKDTSDNVDPTPASRLFTVDTGGCCFPASTKITMADGSYKNIEDIKIGDNVLSYDTEKNRFTSWRVKLPGNPTHPIITINKGLIQSTVDHPFYIKKPNGETCWGAYNIERAKKFTTGIREIIKMEIGDRLFTSEGEWIEITDIKYNPEKVQTYNILSFHGTKTYFANDLLVYEEHPPHIITDWVIRLIGKKLPRIEKFLETSVFFNKILNFFP